MKKIYKNPTTTVYEIKLRDGILQDTSNMEIADTGVKDPGDQFPGGEEEIGAREDNNRGSVWDNAW